jgi:signal transduction histidine kinase
MSASGDVIVLWAADESADGCPWMTNAPAGVRLVLVSPGALVTAVPAARVRGPVVAIVEGDQQAFRALALGVDEVVRVREVSSASLSAATERARLRAMGREPQPAQPEEDSPGIELLAAAVSSRLANPLAVASVNAEILRAAMNAVTGLADAYVRDAAARPDLHDSEVQRVVALRASAPATPQLNATIHDLAAALREASTAVAHVYSLVVPDDGDEACDLTTVVSELTMLMRDVVERVAELRVHLVTDDAVRVAVPRSVVVQALSLLLTHSLQAVRDRSERGTITVRVEPRVAAALVEVIDNGSGMSPSALARALDPPSAMRGAASLAALASRVRRAGGEIVLESTLGVGTTARLFIPILLRREPPDPAAN